jgi:large subunit ribosomal protein L15
MNLSQLRPPRGAKRARKRVGRGNASGNGTYAGKGLKGAKARSGPGPFPGFEGGQLPLVRRMARKRGFKNPFKVRYEEVKVGALRRFAAGAAVGPEALVAAGLVKRPQRPVVIIGGGSLDRAITVRAHRFTAGAKQTIEAAGGTAEVIGGVAAPAEAAGAAPAAE